ncbi:hypothetical protein EDD15DRAFT_2388303 [Pisolithus albus]|nr:hypothetical protein EDD15DRAFT_2388303 [Pisolithus albus]
MHLPAYSRTTQPQASRSNATRGNGYFGSTYSVSLEDSDAGKWLTLHVLSRSPNPTTWRIDLYFLPSESIKSITIEEEDANLRIEKELWSPSISPPDGSKVSKLVKGTFSWPGKVKRDLPFLAIFSEKAGVGYLDYKLMVTMKCEALRVNKTLVTSFACVSVVGKGNLPLLRPEDDPTGTDVQALDLLSSPSSTRLFLVRSLATESNATMELDDSKRREGGKEKRVMQGELEVKRSFKPTCLFPKFATRIAVKVVSFPAPGAVLRSRMPPEYAQENGADYRNFVGLLENGIQRFYHHGAR